MKANLTTSEDCIEAYLKRVLAGLKGMSEPQQHEIVAEIRSHLAERVQQFAGEGSPQPERAAVDAMGDPDDLAQQFARTVSEQRASRSFVPWVLLRAAASFAFTGVKGLFTFLLGLFGFGAALGFTLAVPMKLILPSKVGLWMGPHLLVWGVTSTADAHELAGQYFIPTSLVLAFLFASATTLALRWLTRPELSLQSVLRRKAR